MLMSFLYFWTSQRPLTLLTTNFYSHDLSVVTVSKVMPWPGCVHLSQIGTNKLEWLMIVHLSTINLACVVPQGSALGPILYSMYTAPIADVIKRHGMGFHLYADDTQLHMSFNPVDALKSRSLIKRCIQDVQQWMVVNTLELNGDKTELLILTAPHRPPPPLASILFGYILRYQ